MVLKKFFSLSNDFTEHPNNQEKLVSGRVAYNYVIASEMLKNFTTKNDIEAFF